jgi:hypothetical protein
LARAEALEGLKSGEGQNKLAANHAIEWGRVIEGKPAALPSNGAVVCVGDSIYIRVLNEGPGNIYVSIFDVGLGSKITLLTTSGPSGIELLPGQDYVLGHKEHEGLVGLKLAWAAGIPQDTPRPESLIVILTDAPQDLRTLETKGMGARRDLGESRSQLQQLISQVAWGGKRDLPTEAEGHDVAYEVCHLDFLVDPLGAPAGPEASFLIDERPDPSMLHWSPRTLTEAPTKVAVRLTDLIVHRNRALFSTEIRVDAVMETVCPWKTY